MEQLIKYVNSFGRPSVIDQEVLDICEADIKKLEKLQMESPNENYGRLIQQKQRLKKWLSVFKEFAEEQKLDFNFVLIQANQFNSGFSKKGFEDLKISFPTLKKPVCFKTVTNVLTANKSAGNKFFYLFYKRNESIDSINVFDLVDKLDVLAKEETR